jgi:glycine/D-amino acid oxidase-like deaminating enzyme
VSGYRDISFWFDSLGGRAPETARAPAPTRLEVDVAIVGGGYTGLWTAYYLRQVAPELSVAVLEREIAGFGASGRNGGWCSGLFAASFAQLVRAVGREGAAEMMQAVRSSVDEVGRVAAEEGIECGFSKGGTLVLARTEAQLTRLRREAAGVDGGDPDLVVLSAAEAEERIRARGVLGATYTPHCAAVHPAALARGLAEAVERRGARVCEATPVLDIAPGSCRTPRGLVRAKFVVRATEGYSASIPGCERDLATVYSLMIVTEPLPGPLLDSIGLDNRETFADGRHLIIYGQRTEDGRIAFGGRGARYHLGSKVAPSFDRVPAVHRALHAALVDLFPQLEGVAITHSWGGPLGVPRDFFPAVRFDPRTGIASAGGYVGDGVACSNLAGRTLADLIAGRSTALTRLPWVGHRRKRWEGEPLRFAEVNAALAAMRLADLEEARTGRRSLLARAVSPLIGHT